MSDIKSERRFDDSMSSLSSSKYMVKLIIYISVRICKNVPARPGPEAGHRPASGLCGSLNLRGLAVKDQSVS